MLRNANKFAEAYYRALQPLCLETDLPPLAVDILLFLANNPAYNTAKDICQCRGVKPGIVSVHVDLSLIHIFVPFRDIISLCRAAGNPDMVYEFASTSKITFPGAGVSVVASSEENIRYMTKLLSIQTISYDKVNQLRHVLFLKDKATTLALMQQHATILKPKFDAVIATLQREIAPLGIATWTAPKAVSYTHLDVYKRQAVDRAAPGRVIGGDNIRRRDRRTVGKTGIRCV